MPELSSIHGRCWEMNTKTIIENGLPFIIPTIDDKVMELQEK